MSTLSSTLLRLGLLLGASSLPGFSATIILTFDDAPAPPLGTQVGIADYTENGFHVQPLGPIATSSPFRLHHNGGSIPGFPEIGSPYLQLAFQDSFEMTSISGQNFTPLSVDLAEYSNLFTGPAPITFVGYFSSGGSVSHTFTTDGMNDGIGPGIDFESFAFPSSFAGIERLESTSFSFSMDNFHIEVVPEPKAPLLLAMAAGLLGFRRCRPSINQN
jgi:hypothetical protein